MLGIVSRLSIPTEWNCWRKPLFRRTIVWIKSRKWYGSGGSIIDGSNPKVDSYIGEGVRISALIRRVSIVKRAEWRL